MDRDPRIIEDADGKTTIVTDKKTIAENLFTLKGKNFSLSDFPMMHAIYQVTSKKIVICSGRQIGKCAVGRSLVSAANGEPRRLGSLVAGDQVLSLADDRHLVASPVKETFSLGPKPCLRITTRMGHVLEVATTHPLRRVDGYIAAGNIEVGDRLAAVREGGLFTGTYGPRDEDIALLASRARNDIPSPIFDLDRRQTALFIHHLWANGGGINDDTFGVTSIAVARGLQALLWKFGVTTSLSRRILRVETAYGLRRLLTLPPPETFAADIRWDCVTRIEDIGEHDCFDIEVETRHNYVLDGVVTHNSTTASVFQVAECAGESHWESIAVLPSLMQMRRYSTQRVAKLISGSKMLKKYFIDSQCRSNVTDRSLANGSAMYFGALSQVESLRGLSANRILEDEVQDMVSDDLPIVEEALSGQSSDRQFIMRTGTAKTVGNVLEDTLRESTMNEWIVKCPSGHHNVPSADNIGERGFTCKKCFALCDVRGGYWRAMNGLTDPDGTPRDWVGFRIPQIIIPGHTEDPIKWREIVRKMHQYDPIKFNNEVMGLADGSGISILSEDDLKNCAMPAFDIQQFWNPSKDKALAMMATVDWGLTARKSFTVVALWAVVPASTEIGVRFKLVHVKRFTEPDLYKQVDQIAQMIVAFNVPHVGVDWGAGIMQSRMLEEKIKRRVHRFMYVGDQKELIKWNDMNQTWTVNRTQAMTETFIKMKRGEYWFPQWKFFKDYAKDILCIFEEPLDDRNGNDRIKYDHPADSPDDFCHVVVYSAMLWHLMTKQRGAM
jgi:hypothetical protein